MTLPRTSAVGVAGAFVGVPQAADLRDVRLPTIEQGPGEWTLRGACLTEDPELFFPPGSPETRDYQAVEVLAKAICRRCPVTAECLDYATRHREQGIWGGLNDRERQTLRRGRPAHRPAPPRIRRFWWHDADDENWRGTPASELRILPPDGPSPRPPGGGGG